jgi:predicted nucleic acid-binding protein
MSMRYLLDTSALLAHYRQELGWEVIQALLEDRTSEITLASPSLAEFSRRMHDLGADDSAIQDILDEYRLLFDDVVSIDGSTATAAYRITRQAISRIPLVDALIAAAALMDRAVLVHNDKHMAAIPTEVLKQQALS